jgi:hypothetical protein
VILLKLLPPLLLLLTLPRPPLSQPLLLLTLPRPPLSQPLLRLLKPLQNKSGRFPKPTHV